MSIHQTKTNPTWRRAELMAEIFLQELEPEFVVQPTADEFAFDFLIGFSNQEGGVNTYAVEVTATEQRVEDAYQVPRQLFNRLAHSNIPLLLLVVDVKHNAIYYSWPSQDKCVQVDAQTVAISLTQVDEDTRKALRQRMLG